ncbi:MAG: CubicO group peptidase (beta-lactamase class C family) [Brevundimonas sp.]|jgi:CubicO group peptidase (beta-lactamase class C family)|uniref:serine hydrolase n=1 Tax=Brevundimonas sp. TaxID=1871086 RepID=UPI0039E485D6
MSLSLSRRAALSLSTAAAGAAVLPRRSWARDAARDQALADAVDAYVTRSMAAFPDQPGLGVALVRGGETVLAKGYGVRRQDQPASRVDETTLFAVASNTKAMTAASLGMLVDEERVQWDAPVRTYLPDFRLSDPFITERITVRDLLSHRAGFGLGAGDLLFWPNSDRTRAEIMAAIPNVPIEHGFRAGYHYCNLMFVAAGEVIAAVSGMPWEDFVQTRVLTPLGMADTVPLTSRADPARSALPHGRIGPPLRYQGEMTLLEDSIVGIWNWDSAGAAGGFAASPRDWAQWMKTQLASGVAPDGTRLWSEAVAREMWRPNVISGSSPGPTAELPGRSIASTYAMGWSVADYRGERMVTHGGGSPGGISATVLIPGRDTGFAVFSNAEESYLLRALRSGIADIVMAEDRDFSAFDWIADGQRLLAESTERSLTAAAEIDAKQAAGAAPSLPLSAYAGTWRDPWYGDIVISQRDGGLWLDFTRSNALKGPLEPYDGETFRTRFPDRREEDAFVMFEMADGVPVSATLKGVSPDIDFSYDYQDLRLTRV